mgnify:CR=1 FL=1
MPTDALIVVPDLPVWLIWAAPTAAAAAAAAGWITVRLILNRWL